LHDILVHAKEIVGGVLALNLGDEIVVQFVCGAHAIAFVGTEEIDVYAAAGKGREALEKLGQADAVLFVGLVLPKAVDVHVELGVAVGVRREVGGQLCDATSDCAKKNLAQRLIFYLSRSGHNHLESLRILLFCKPSHFLCSLIDCPEFPDSGAKQHIPCLTQYQK